MEPHAIEMQRSPQFPESVRLGVQKPPFSPPLDVQQVRIRPVAWGQRCLPFVRSKELLLPWVLDLATEWIR